MLRQLRHPPLFDATRAVRALNNLSPAVGGACMAATQARRTCACNWAQNCLCKPINSTCSIHLRPMDNTSEESSLCKADLPHATVRSTPDVVLDDSESARNP